MSNHENLNKKFNSINIAEADLHVESAMAFIAEYKYNSALNELDMAFEKNPALLEDGEHSGHSLQDWHTHLQTQTKVASRQDTYLPARD